jgi:hypothetical protein
MVLLSTLTGLAVPLLIAMAMTVTALIDRCSFTMLIARLPRNRR